MQYVIRRNQAEDYKLFVENNAIQQVTPTIIEVGSTKRKKVREVDFENVLTDIFKKAKKEQLQNKMKYGELYSLNYYVEVKEKKPQLL